MNHLELVIKKARSRFERRKEERSQNCADIGCLIEGKDTAQQLLDKIPRIVKRAKTLGLFQEAGDLLSNPEDKATAARVYEKIIGSNDFLGIGFVKNAASLSRAVGRISLSDAGGLRVGTGFMVTPRLLMTNNHVLQSNSEAAAALVEFDFYEREDRSTGPSVSYRFSPEEFFITNERLDFSIIAVHPQSENVPADILSERGWFPLIAESGKAVIGERVNIIQHPNGQPQKIAIHDNKIVDAPDDFLHYTTDTMGGSSGSPVCNSSWDLAALHHAAFGNKNEGIRISSIVNYLDGILSQESPGAGRDPILFEQLLSEEVPQFGSDSLVPGAPPSYPQSTAPTLGSSGAATWTIPITLSVNLGSSGLPVVASPPPIRQPAKVLPATPGEKIRGGELLDLPEGELKESLGRAIEAARLASSRTYYSKVEDEAARNAYYPSLENLNKRQCYEILSSHLSDTHHTTLKYAKARLEHLYPWIDRREDTERSLIGIYSGKTFDVFEVLNQEVANQAIRERLIKEHRLLESGGAEPDAEFFRELETSNPYNCEHVVPQSWFNKEKQPKTDLHHLFTCEWGCNSFRGNHAYFQFTEEAFREQCGRRENGKFEPHLGKGAAARASLYFLLRYPGKIGLFEHKMPKNRLPIIIQWAKEDKVDRWELHRNAEIEKVQGNRNPLIDFPELVDKIDFRLGFA